MTTRYTVEILRSGQPRAYADTIREYLITVEFKSDWGPEPREFEPWIMGGDIDKEIAGDSLKRPASRWETAWATQHAWALGLVKTLCQRCREATDEDGRIGVDAYFYPTLRSLYIDPTAGTIRAVIVEPFTD